MTRARYDVEALSRFVARLFAGEGLPEDHAAMVADALLTANLRGVDTHGVVRVPAYVKRLRAGLLNPKPRMREANPMPVSFVLDADNAMGPVGAFTAIEACMSRAAEFGVGASTVRHSNHFGAASVYTVHAARRGFIAIAMSPGARTLAPHGSRAPLLGTNPFAVAAPAGQNPPWSLDMAASVAARGHIRVAAQEGRSIPEGWALDEKGRPTTDPEAALNGVMLPFGGPKGSGLAMMVDILAGVLAGSAFTGDIRDWVKDFTGPSDVGHFFLVVKVEAFMPAAEFADRMETAILRTKALPPAEGAAEVFYPGERSGRMEQERRQNGIPLSGKAIVALAELATTDCPFPEPVGER